MAALRSAIDRREAAVLAEALTVARRPGVTGGGSGGNGLDRGERVEAVWERGSGG